MIDLHSHILPGIDDGANDLQESIQMAEQAVAAGIHTMVATPHHLNGYENRAQSIMDAVEHLQQELKKRDIPLTVLAGQEVRISQRTVAEFVQGHLLPLAGTQYMLIEFPATQIPTDIFDVMHELLLQRIVPILAHPERNREIMKRPDWLHAFIEAGGKVQLTAQSLTLNRKLRNRCLTLFRQRTVHFLASDTHNTDRRPPALKEAYAVVAAHVGEKTVQYLQNNAELVLNNEQIPPPPTPEGKWKWKLFS